MTITEKLLKMKQSINRLKVTEPISFDQNTETRQVKYDGEDVGTILIDKITKRKKFRSKAINIDGLHRLAEWVEDKQLSKRIQVHTIRTKPSPIFNLFLKIVNVNDKRLEEFAAFIYRNEQIENLPF